LFGGLLLSRGDAGHPCRLTEVFRGLDPAVTAAGEVAPLDEVGVRLEQLLPKPTGVVGVEGLGGLAGPDVVHVEADQGVFEPAFLELSVEGGFLSLVSHEGFFCAGAAHPDSNRLALVFDLSTGKSVDWEQLLPGKAQTKKFDADLEARPSSGSLISSDAIWALYKKSALLEDGNDPDCAGVFDEQLDLMLSLDAEKIAVAFSRPRQDVLN